MTWPLNGSEAGGGLVLIQTSLLFFVNQVVLMVKAERSVSKQDHLQTRCHSNARSPSRLL